MLVLSRKNRETVVIDGCITVKVLQIKGNTIRLGIEAPRDMSIRRGELLEGGGDEAASDSAAPGVTLEIALDACFTPNDADSAAAAPVTYNCAAS